MAVWRNYPSVKVASLQKINFPADQWPDNSKWFKFLSSASPSLRHTFSFTLYSLTSQLPHMLVSLFIHAQYHMLPFPWYFFSHLVSSHTPLPPPSPKSSAVSQSSSMSDWSLALHLHDCTCAAVTVAPKKHLGYSSCTGDYRREDKRRGNKQSLQSPGLQSVMSPLQVSISISWD